MRSFLFKNIWLLSSKDQRARYESIHPLKTLIVGRNHTGKSSLIKTMFLTLGARPQGKLSHWDENTLSLVEFSVDGQGFFALYQHGNRALFTDQGNLILATGKHEEWSRLFAKTVGFNLFVTDKDDESIQADPRCFFLPFYVNQDGSWQAKWDTFVGLQQYRTPMGSILEYFTGIKPPEYYKMKTEREIEQNILDSKKNEQQFLDRARTRFAKSMSLSGPKINPENFKLEIARLTATVTELNQKQEILRDKAVRERELIANLDLQIRLAEDALGTYKSDARFLQTKPREKLVCPTCRAEHAESFIELLTYAEDARVLRDLVVRLREDALELRQQLEKTEKNLLPLNQDYQTVSEILNTRRGELIFQQVVDSAGAESAFRAFEDESIKLQEDINKHLVLIAALADKMSILTNKKRSKSILDRFRQAYAATTHALNLPAISTAKLRLTSRPDLSGSGGPRSVLAYYGALWSTCYGPSASFAVPLVIDAPNQQGQDDINLPKVLSFISRDLPSQAQIIVGSEIDTEYKFEKKIVLDEPYKLLREADFTSVEKFISPFEKAMYDRLLQREGALP